MSGTAASELPALEVFLLGGFRVRRDGTFLPPEAFRRRRAADLLQLLSLTPGGACRRDEAIRALWPEKSQELGANNLHRALHDLRHSLGGEYVTLEKGTLRLSGDAWVDVRELEALLARGDPTSLAAALELYRGELCPDAPDADWLEARRTALRHRFADGVLRLARHHTASGGHAAGIDALRRLLALDDTEEEAHRLLMRLLLDSGRPREAEEAFEACAAALRAKLDSSPSRATLELLETVRRRDGERARAEGNTARRVSRRLLGSASPSPIRGRDAELASLRALVDDGAGLLLLVGEAGAGKTRLAVEGARWAAERGALVLSGAGLDIGEGAPYLPFVEAFADHLHDTGLPLTESPFEAFLPTPGGAPQEDKLRLFSAVERSLFRLAGERPVYLLVDELHLFSESSLHLFHYLARATRKGPLVLVGTCREEAVAPASPLAALLHALVRERLGTRLSLAPLDAAATRAQIGDLLGREPEQELARSVHELTGGNCYFTEEVVGAGGEAAPKGRMAVGVPRDLASMLRERSAALGPEPALLLDAAAVVGTRFSFDLARAVSGLGRDAALAALDRALAGRLVEEAEEGYRFRHALAREALYQALGKARRAELHRAAAAALEEGPRALRVEHTEELAFHHLQGGSPERALPHLVLAGQRAAARAGFRESAAFFERALSVMRSLRVPPGPEKFALLLGLGQLRIALSDLTAAVQELDAAAQLIRPSDGWRPSPGERAQARRWAALALITAGDLAAADERLDAAQSDLAEAPADPEWPNVLYHLAQLRWHEGRHREAYETAERCLARAEGSGDPAVLARAYEMLALACHALGEWRSGLDFEERRRSIAGATLDVAQAFDVHL